MQSLTGIALISAEQKRARAMGFTLEKDLDQEENILAYAGACYAIAPTLPEQYRSGYRSPGLAWTLEPEKWKPHSEDRIHELVKAGALIASELDRILSEGNISSFYIKEKLQGSEK